MRRILSLAICALMLCPLALAATGGEVLPDPSEALGQAGALLREDYLFSTDYLCDAYVYLPPEDASAFLDQYEAIVRDSGFDISPCVADGQDAYRIESPVSGLYALLFPEYEGRLLFLVQDGMRLSTEPEPTPTPTPRATSRPETGGGSASTGSHVEYVIQQTPCLICHTTGKCSLCNGTGIYRAYGESVLCDLWCSYCNGLGYIEQTVPILVPN